MKIVDAFTFYNELDLLEIRLDTLAPFVDYFVICESTSTFSGLEKPLILTENMDRFARYSSKIIIHTVQDLPKTDPWAAEWSQRNALKIAIESLCDSDDRVIVGDADEIVDPNALEIASDVLASHSLAHFAQNLYYYYLNLQEVSGTLLSASGDVPGAFPKKWLGSRMMRADFALQSDLNLIRGPETLRIGRRIPQGGWHFSFVGSEGSVRPEDRIRLKLSAYAHQEKNTRRIRRSAGRRVSRNEDIFGRKGAKFEVVPLDGTFPIGVTKNLEKYKNLIAQSEAVPKRRLKLPRLRSIDVGH